MRNIDGVVSDPGEIYMVDKAEYYIDKIALESYRLNPHDLLVPLFDKDKWEQAAPLNKMLNFGAQHECNSWVHQISFYLNFYVNKYLKLLQPP